MDMLTYILSKKYTDKVVSGLPTPTDKYLHNILIRKVDTDYYGSCTIQIINDNSSAYAMEDFIAYMSDNTSSSKPYIIDFIEYNKNNSQCLIGNNMFYSSGVSNFNVDCVNIYSMSSASVTSRGISFSDWTLSDNVVQL